MGEAKEVSTFEKGFQITVDPLSQATATYESTQVSLNFGKIPKISVNHGLPFFKQPPVGLFEDYQKDTQAQRLKEIINSPHGLEEAIPLPFSRTDVSIDGTRGLKAMVNDFPNDIICFTGIGVVKVKKNNSDGIDKNLPKIQIDPPRSHETISQHDQVGTIHVDAEGNIWRERNDSPFGAYDIESLQKKVLNTQTLGSEFGPKVIAAGTWDGTEMGWMAYALPKDVLTPTELLKLDLKLPADKRGALYGPIVAQALRQVKKLHIQGTVHHQLHPGNWYARIGDEGTQVLFTDWETAIKYAELPPSSDFIDKSEFSRETYVEGQFAGLTPQQKAIALDIFHSLSSTRLIDSPDFKERTSIEERTTFSFKTSALYVTRETVDYEIEMLARGVLAYSQEKFSPDEVRAAQDKLFRIYKSKAFRIAKQNNMYSGDDFDEMIEQDSSERALRAASQELLLDVAKTLASSNSF